MTDKKSMEDAWVWVVLTISLWLGLLAFIWIIKVCSRRQSRRRCLCKVFGPVCKKLGLKVSWAENPEQGTSPSPGGGVNVFVVASPSYSDLPPSYEMAMTYINHAFHPALPVAPPSYDQIATATSPTMTSEGTPSSPRDGDVNDATSSADRATATATAAESSAADLSS
ncbi:uncharacterized protein LOC143299707 isoform X2 [Babylonia areolata]